MAQSKRIRAKKIREKLTASTPAEQNTAAAENVDVAKGIEKVASFVDQITSEQKKFFGEFLIEIKKISSSTQDFKKQQKLLKDNISKASDILENKDKNIDEEETQKNISEEEESPRKPRTFKEKLANQQFKGNPAEVEQKGYFGALFGQAKREIFGGEIELEEKKTIKEKTQNNLKGTNVLEKYLSLLLSEVTIIRKVVEGRIKFDPKLKGSQYYEEDAKGEKAFC